MFTTGAHWQCVSVVLNSHYFAMNARWQCVLIDNVCILTMCNCHYQQSITFKECMLSMCIHWQCVHVGNMYLLFSIVTKTNWSTSIVYLFTMGACWQCVGVVLNSHHFAMGACWQCVLIDNVCTLTMCNFCYNQSWIDKECMLSRFIHWQSVHVDNVAPGQNPNPFNRIL